MSALIAPSLLSADFTNLGEAVRAAERGGADWLHVDVMDGHFVPNITLGPLVVKAITAGRDRAARRAPDDLGARPLSRGVRRGGRGENLGSCRSAAAPAPDACSASRGSALKAGVALNPSTPVVMLEDVVGDLDHVLVMSVNPGFGGQTFIPRSESKVRAVRELLSARGASALIEIDGGIDAANAARVVAAGVDMLVAGQAIFGSADPAAAIRELRAAVTGAAVR